MAAELGVGELTLADIVEELKKPARDPREDAPPVVFRNDVKSFDDLKIDMEMTGTVRNVVDFGAFVDIGVKNDGLVHISQISKDRVEKVKDKLQLNDEIEARVIKIDKDERRIGLSIKALDEDFSEDDIKAAGEEVAAALRPGEDLGDMSQIFGALDGLKED